MSGADRHVEVAKVGRAHGIRGEVRVFPLNPLTETLHEGASFRWQKGRKQRSLRVEVLRPAKGFYLVQFEGIGQRDDAAVLNGGMLSVPRSALPVLDDGELYLDDLLGLTVIDEASGEVLGQVARLGESSVEVLEIALERGGVVLVPWIDQYVGLIDLRAGTVRVRDIQHWIDA